MRPQRVPPPADRPGSFAPLHTWDLFPSSNPWGLPDLPAYTGPLPGWLLPYSVRPPRPRRPPALPGAWMFFLDDHYFEPVWTRPHASLRRLQALPLALTPDFSLYRNWPLACQLWNIYRTRWCGAWWLAHEIGVIPTLNWSTPASYAFAFAGIAPGGWVAVGVPSGEDAATAALWIQGYRAMLDAVQPAGVLAYGPLPPGLRALVPTREYPARWTNIRAALHAGRAITDADRCAYLRSE